MKRATCLSSTFKRKATISIHALVKRATFRPVSSSRFQAISIHALVKRATFYTLSGWGAADYFNPRPREEGDIDKIGIAKRIVNFNPRPREEGDLLDEYVISVQSDFNPRPREEGDAFNFIKNDLSLGISIHALVKRATVADT